MDRGPHPDYARWVVAVGEPRKSRMLPEPVPAIVTTQLYDGSTATLTLPVIATAAEHVCVEQAQDDRPPWRAWISKAHARPL